MGVPSYFSYVLRKHKNLLKETHHVKCDILYLDSNSLIYDSISEGDIHKSVYKKVLNIISMFKPRKTYVVFDGMAPMAKMHQQKERRYKSYVTKQILGVKGGFNTNQITPGTTFMNELDKYLETKFNNHSDIVYNGPNVAGEGEQKIYNILKSEPVTYNHIVYGLDADLIMLSLMAHPYKIFLYRETSNFAYLNWVIESKQYVLDIKKLAEQLSHLMKLPLKSAVQNYCMLCFLCGNDFLPHFPSLNIRNNVIEYLLDVYSRINTDSLINPDNTINWDQMGLLFYELASKENELTKQEVKWKQSRRVTNITEEDRLNNLPLADMTIENRLIKNMDKYNKILFGRQHDDDICNNYLDMLNWCWQYYNGIMLDNTKHYKSAYAPQFKSLIKHIPVDNVYETTNVLVELHPHTQLMYVLPYTDYDSLPFKYEHIVKKFPELQQMNYKINYAFCKFFWESHVTFGNIDIIELNNELKN
jgi:5'-3' exoribonuclease 1